MTNFVEVKIEGTDALLNELREAGGNVRKTIRAATKRGADIVRDAALTMAPPTRRKKILVVKASFPTRNACEAQVKLAKKAWYLKFAETGVTAHEIKRGAGPIVFEGDTGLVVTGSVQHTGHAARPFLRPAVDGYSEDAIRAMGDTITAAVLERRVLTAKADDED